MDSFSEAIVFLRMEQIWAMSSCDHHVVTMWCIVICLAACVCGLHWQCMEAVVYM